MAWKICVLTCAVLAALLAACGGNGDSSSPSNENAPVARSGEPQTVMVNDLYAFLDGRGSSDPQGLQLSYKWRVVSRPAGSSADLTDDFRSAVGFRPDLKGTYLIGLTVSNGLQTSEEATVAITATENIVAEVSRAAFTAQVDLDARTVVLAWNDTAPAGAVYRLQSLDANGKATTLGDFAGQGGIGAPMQWSGPIAGAQGWQALALAKGSTALLWNAGGQRAPIVLPLTPGPMSIQVDRPQPVNLFNRDAYMYIANTGGYDRVEWYIDSHRAGYRDADGRLDGYRVQIPSNYDAYPTPPQPYLDGVHAVLVHAKLANSLDVQLRGTIDVVTLGVYIDVQRRMSTSEFGVIVAPSSQYGVGSIELWVDGVSQGAVSEFNWCLSARYCPAFDTYGYLISLSNGSHTLFVTFIDKAGRHADLTQAVVVN